MQKIKATKSYMTQIWKDDTVIPVTVLKVKDDMTPLDIFKEGALVNIRGVSKGKGFQGVVKRHGFHGGPKTHGQKNRLRAPGSIGSTAPQRVIKGRKMAGHMGNRNITVRNLEIAAVRMEERTLLVKGAVPGSRGRIVEVRV
ncbi:50S ribosomal protein L3 [Candidatus Jorgensenbacteria bacterium]|nr:50S ribosomal protein L3 [Candidatus Jorgensenbacteria bacterium]